MPGHLGGPALWRQARASGMAVASSLGWLRKPMYGRRDFRDPGALHHGCKPPGRTNKPLPLLKHRVVVRGVGEEVDEDMV